MVGFFRKVIKTNKETLGSLRLFVNIQGCLQRSLKIVLTKFIILIWPKSLNTYKSRGELSIFVESRTKCVFLAYFERKKYNFLTLICIVQKLQFCIFFVYENMKAPLQQNCRNFQHYWSAQNQLKSKILFLKIAHRLIYIQ